MVDIGVNVAGSVSQSETARIDPVGFRIGFGLCVLCVCFLRGLRVRCQSGRPFVVPVEPDAHREVRRGLDQARGQRDDRPAGGIGVQRLRVGTLRRMQVDEPVRRFPRRFAGRGGFHRKDGGAPDGRSRFHLDMKRDGAVRVDDFRDEFSDPVRTAPAALEVEGHRAADEQDDGQFEPAPVPDQGDEQDQTAQRETERKEGDGGAHGESLGCWVERVEEV